MVWVVQELSSLMRTDHRNASCTCTRSVLEFIDKSLSLSLHVHIHFPILLQNPRMYLNKYFNLIIEPAEFSDGGRYTCTPFNNIGTAGESTGTNLKIRMPPYFTQRPKSAYEAEIGKTLNIYCRGGGKPPPNVSWRKVRIG